MYQLAKEDSKNNTRKSNNGGLSSPSRTIIHAKLEMGAVEDSDEIEADIAADDIVERGVLRRKISSGHESSGVEISPQMEGSLNSLAGGGHVMPDGLKNIMENGFNHDFSSVKLHTDNSAAELSENIHAKAFTLGNDIYFNRGQFNPHSLDGQKLVAHELAHVVQKTSKINRKPSDEKQESESIAVVGTQYKKDNNKTTFINEGIRYLLNQEGVTKKTMIIFDYEYSEKLMNGLDSELKKHNIKLIKIKETSELRDYINQGNNSISRETYKIKGIGIFSHGIYDEKSRKSKFSFGYHIDGEGSATENDLLFGTDEAKKLNKNAFANDATIQSFACQTARDGILAQQLANSSGAIVIATNHKTTYKNSAGNRTDRYCSDAINTGGFRGFLLKEACGWSFFFGGFEAPILSKPVLYDGYPIFPEGSPRDVELGDLLDENLSEGWRTFHPKEDESMQQ